MRKLLLAATSTILLLGLASPAQAADSITIGASGDASQLRSHTGSALATHLYGKLSGPALTNGALVNIETTVPWSQVASGGQDANIKRWASALKGKNIMVSFSHEPMAKQNTHWGTAASFIAAFKHVVTVFRSSGSTSVKWVWNATSDSFRGGHATGAQWYPGDSYVDYIAGEAYNKYGCGGPNTSLADKIKEIFAFAGQHNKKFVVAEFASNKFSGRAAWLSAATSYMNANRSRFAGAFYYQSHNTGGGCHWMLDSTAEYNALSTMLNTL